MNKKILLTIILTMGIVVFFQVILVDFIESDSCFDHGGRWNHKIKDCEY